MNAQGSGCIAVLILLLISGCYQETTAPPDDSSGAEEPVEEEPADDATAGPSSSEIPHFPWPPPRASTMVNIDLGLPVASEDSIRLGDVDAVLSQALHTCGYVEKSYFAVPDGFALVTRLEQIQPDGTPKDPPDRWSLEVGPIREFDLRAYLRALFTANPGYYRIIVFIVTPHPFTQSGEGVEREEAVEWLNTGLNRLPAELASQPYTAAFATTALVYEFEQPESEEATLQVPGRLTARTHLTRAGLMDAMEDAR